MTFRFRFFALYVDAVVKWERGAVGRVFSLFPLFKFHFSLLIQKLRYAVKF